jgi:N6-adenosine-specific RNA methylase IME4
MTIVTSNNRSNANPNILIDPEFRASIPPLKPEEFKQLEANILKDGRCNDPLCVWKGCLLDGYNRYEICQRHRHIEFSTVEIDCGETRDHALAWIEEHQLGRRNISDDVRAVLAKRLTQRSDIAKTERAQKGGEAGGRSRPKDSLSDNVSDKLSKPKKRKGDKKDTRKAVAKKHSIPERKLRTALAIDKKAADDAEPINNMVICGKITLNEGKKLAALPDDNRRDAIKAVDNGTDVRTAVREAKKQSYNTRIAATKPKPLEGTYRIIYADSPWKYHGLNQVDEYGHAEAHYDCLDDDQLCQFRPDGKRLVNDLADENDVLLKWVPAPLLESSFRIIRAWGFKYKANFVWDKQDHNMDFYNSVRHEHLLIATKGSCTPDIKKLFDSVQSIRRTEHSRKPTEFYDIIETLYDHGRKLELFARSGRRGWDSVGNEVYQQEGSGVMRLDHPNEEPPLTYHETVRQPEPNTSACTTVPVADNQICSLDVT